jgi:hypothetical protein
VYEHARAGDGKEQRFPALIQTHVIKNYSREIETGGGMGIMDDVYPACP